MLLTLYFFQCRAKLLVIVEFLVYFHSYIEIQHTINVHQSMFYSVLIDFFLNLYAVKITFERQISNREIDALLL